MVQEPQEKVVREGGPDLLLPAVTLPNSGSTSFRKQGTEHVGNGNTASNLQDLDTGLNHWHRDKTPTTCWEYDARTCHWGSYNRILSHLFGDSIFKTEIIWHLQIRCKREHQNPPAENTSCPYRIQQVTFVGLRYIRYRHLKQLCDPHSIHLAIHLWPRRVGANPPLLLDACSILPQNRACFSYCPLLFSTWTSSSSCSFDCVKVKNATNHVCTCLHQYIMVGFPAKSSCPILGASL